MLLRLKMRPTRCNKNMRKWFKSLSSIISNCLGRKDLKESMPTNVFPGRDQFYRMSSKWGSCRHLILSLSKPNVSIFDLTVPRNFTHVIILLPKDKITTLNKIPDNFYLVLNTLTTFLIKKGHLTPHHPTHVTPTLSFTRFPFS